MSDERVLRRARATWRAAIEEDDATAAADRQRRIAWRLQAGRTRAPSSIALVRVAVVASVALVAAAGWAGRGPGGWLRRRPASTGQGEAAQTTARAAASRAKSSARGAGVSSTAEAAPEPAAAIAHDEWTPPLVAVTVESLPGEREAPEIAAPADAKADPGIDWVSAEAALRDGDRATAERYLRRVLGRAAPSSRLWERACFALAELELARGAKASARARLEQLQGSRDRALAGDAAFLEARASDSARERAALYARYLAGAPPSPYRERALVDEARALFDAGDVSAARSRVAALRAGGPLPDVAAAALAPLERELAAVGGSGVKGEPRD